MGYHALEMAHQRCIQFFSIAAVSVAWRHQGGGIYAGTGGQFKMDTALIIDPSSDARVLDMSQIGPILDCDGDV